jgi:Phytanoyl-CoA dioxygenase (PhyH)
LSDWFDGYVVIPDLIASAERDRIVRSIEDMLTEGAGTRRLIDIPWCGALAERIGRDERLRETLPVGATAVQCTLFVKSIEKNWLVSLHQDLSIPVAERIDSPECSGWSEKEGEVYVQPPISVLQNILAVRLHLDDCDERNGALRVVPGSHRLGRLTPADVLRERDARGETSVPVPRGGAMLMRPLLLHASSKSSVDNARRVLHFVFGPAELPADLRWPYGRRSLQHWRLGVCASLAAQDLPI